MRKSGYVISVLFFSLTLIASERPMYLDNNQTIEKRVEDLLSRMTLEEKVSLCHANSKFTVSGVERLNIPSLNLSDGPHGVREEIGPHSWDPAGWTTDSATYMPTGTALAATWNPDLARAFGKVLGEEARARGKDILLGPAINIQRTPLCGRNFEYLSEDPWLISEMVVPYIQGVQEQDVAACVKHYVVNNQEYERFKINVKVDERTLNEIYFPGFKAAVQRGKVLTVMGSYNQYNGTFVCNNEFLLKKVLKEDWGFSGLVMSDWDATHNTLESARAGLDLEMGTNVDSYNEYFFGDSLLNAVKKGQLDEEVVDDKVRRILRVMFKINLFDERKSGSFNTPEHQSMARKVAEEAIVLLKNEQNTLPLDYDQLKSIAVIGDNATRTHAKGGYSSGIKALYEVTPLDGLKAKVGDNLEIHFAQGYEKTSEEVWGKGVVYTSDPVREQALIQEAVEIAKKCDVAIIFGGLNHDFDTEGIDRLDMKLPYTQNELIKAVHQANPKTAVVLIAGSPVEIYEWIDQIPAVLMGWYAGMEGGNALADVLFGDINPSGKLPFTFPVRLEDSPAHALGEYPGQNFEVSYNEKIFVGYRYFDKWNVPSQFGFGHGLSYTEFEYGNLKINSEGHANDPRVQIEFTVRNRGDRDGMEVAQVYVGDVDASVERPLKELKAFKKVYLKAGETGKLSFSLDRQAFSFYDINVSSWKVEPGIFCIFIGGSSQDIRLSHEIELIQK